MGQTINSGKVTASLELTASSKKTVTLITGGGHNATITIGTVTVGKVWRIISIMANLSVYNNATMADMQILLNDVVKYTFRNYSVTATTVGNWSVSQEYDYTCCPVLTAGQTIKTLSPNTSSEIMITIGYIEEDP